MTQDRKSPRPKQPCLLKCAFLKKLLIMNAPRVSVQGVKSLGGHFACLCRGFEFYEVKTKIF